MKIIFLNYSSINLLPQNIFFFKIEEEKNWKKERKMKRVIYFKITLRAFNFFFVYRLALFCGLADFCQTNQKIDRSCLAPDSASLETRGWWLDHVSDVDRTSSSPREPAVPRWRASRGLWSVRRVFQFSRTPVSESGTRFPWLISRSWSLHVFTIFLVSDFLNTSVGCTFHASF